MSTLRSAVTESDSWYVEYVGMMQPEMLHQMVKLTFTDDALGCMSREEMLAHVATHGDYHRSAVGRISPQLSVLPFTDYLDRADPRRREHL